MPTNPAETLGQFAAGLTLYHKGKRAFFGATTQTCAPPCFHPCFWPCLRCFRAPASWPRP